jgi:hypothetical protein
MKSPKRRRKSPKKKRIRGGGAPLRPVSSFPPMCQHGEKCIPYNGKYFSVENADRAEECRIITTLDGIENGIYTYILYLEKKNEHTTEQLQQLIDVCECSWDSNVVVTRRAAKQACALLLPHIRLVVGKTYTTWERGTKHSCLLGCLKPSDLLIGAGELRARGSNVDVNALSGTYMLQHLKAESERRNISMKMINTLYLDNCMVGILRRISPLTTVLPSSDEFITKQTTAPTVGTRLQQMIDRNIPVYKFDTEQECLSENFKVESAMLDARLKNDLRKLEMMRRFLSPDKIEQKQKEMVEKYDGLRDLIKRPTRWDGTF